MPFILEPKHLGKDNVSQVGGKSANLAELINAGFPVPDVFFVTVEAYNKFLEHNDLKARIHEIANNTDYSDVKSLTSSSESIKKLIVEAKMPEEIKSAVLAAYRKLYGAPQLDISIIKPMEKPFVSVRSSGVSEDAEGASSAGQYETFLNVRGDNDVISKIKLCWASLYTSRVMYYRHKNNQPQESSIGVIIQRMVNSEKAGVAFTIDPTNPVKGANHIIIEGCWGLGETMVQGEVDPDRYIVNKENGDILEKHIGEKAVERIRDPMTEATVKKEVAIDRRSAQLLSDYEILALAAYCKKIEQHYGRPQDIEWGVERKNIYILQARAVTTLEEKITRKVEGTPILEGYGASPGVATGVVKIITNLDEIDKIQKGDVLVTEMTSPDYVPAMEKSVAIVTNSGGSTCHAAIVSRELGIPCIVGTKKATEVLKEGMRITVDASNGKVYPGEVEIETQESEEHLDIKTKTDVKVNLAFPETAEKAKYADGVGLMRLEHMLTKTGMHPIEYIRQGKSQELTDIIFENVEKVAQAFYPKHVWVRSLDARTDEFRNMKGGENEPTEDNPMLGWHGIRRSLDEPEILKAELRALKMLHDKGLDNVVWELPFIINVNELRKSKEIAKEVGAPENFGIMVETPACALNIEEFCRAGIAFASFGSNDLTQTALGIDRNNARLIELFDEMHPGMKFLFKHVIETCNKYGVESSICGELPSNRKDAVEFLVKTGIKSLSVNIDAIDKVRKWVSEIEG
ncbi:MAG: phosphoenolpyruvate synthase [Candidatus Aenigmarchaeota archaeon]|nr:phosphoenolpyruvate synthase [Candidatus Aenigmarchaeota archaeon]